MIAFADYILVVDSKGESLSEALVEVKSPSGTTFTSVDLGGGPEEAELGFYNFQIPKILTQETGTYIFRVTAYEFEEFLQRECLPKPLTSVPAPDTCIVEGNIRNATGSADIFSNVKVIARALKLPAQFQGTFTLGRNVIRYTDHDGYFSMPLIRGLEVIISIPDAAIRFQVVIPDTDTVRLEDLLP